MRSASIAQAWRRRWEVDAPGFESAVAEALEFAHGAFHFLAGGVGGGTDALDTEAEIVRVGGAHESFFESDEVARIEIEDRLIECLHTVLAGAGGGRRANPAGFFGVCDV